MGSIGGLLGMSGGAGGTGFSTQAGTSAGQINNAYANTDAAMNAQNQLLTALQNQGGIQAQNQVYQQLQGVVNGQGPNPAQAMLNQATGQNVANQAALMAGQRGASQNAGLLARQAGMQGANIQQQAAGQSATMQAQQALGALGQASGQANTMAANRIGQTNANAQAQQGEQGLLQSANSQNNAIQGQLANTMLQGQQGLIGGVMQGAGALAGMASGGEVPSAFNGAQSMFGQFLNSSGGQMPSISSSDPGAQALQQGVSSGMQDYAKKKSANNPNSGLKAGQQSFQNNFLQSVPSAPGGMETIASGGPLMAASKGGRIDAMVSPGEKVLDPKEAKEVAKGQKSPMQAGGMVPGQAKVKGDSYSNDVVPAKLPVGGVVIPRSVMQSKNPEKGAAEFVRAVLAKKKVKG